MNNNTLLISYKTLTQSSELNENIDPNIILPLIKEMQEMELKPVLGTNLFEKLKAEIEAGTLAGYYKELVSDYCKPVLINAILVELPFKLNYRFSNVGVVTRTSEAASRPEYRDLDKLSDMYKGKRVYYANELAKYLCNNYSEFPEYNSENRSSESPKSDTYHTGIYLG
ncbi:MAG: hypothetical protein ABIN67_13805 [Ferruginibacter sp.]